MRHLGLKLGKMNQIYYHARLKQGISKQKEAKQTKFLWITETAFQNQKSHSIQ